MGPLGFVMIIMGCADGGGACVDARSLPVAYVSREACQTAQVAMLTRNSDLEFPVIQAECREKAPQVARWDDGSKG